MVKVVTINKSPFFVVEEFLSPLMCETILDYVDYTVPDTDPDGIYIQTNKTCEQAELIIYERLCSVIPTIQDYYNFIYKGTETIRFEWFPHGSKSNPISENSMFLNGKWSRVNSRDFTCVLFLSDYQDKIPFEADYEVYGGKLEFAQHKFGFNPARGTLVIFPSNPHFINNTANVHYGHLFQARIQIAANQPWSYNPSDFPGNYTNWFQQYI